METCKKNMIVNVIVATIHGIELNSKKQERINTMKKNPREAISSLIGALRVLLGVYVFGGVITAIVLLILQNQIGWIILVTMLLPVILFGVLISLLDMAFSDTIDELERLDSIVTYGVVKARNSRTEKSKNKKKDNRVRSTPTAEVMSDDYDKFCDNVCAALENVNELEQSDWLEYWLEELQQLQKEESDEEKQQIYVDEIAYLELSLKALEEE